MNILFLNLKLGSDGMESKNSSIIYKMILRLYIQKKNP